MSALGASAIRFTQTNEVQGRASPLSFTFGSDQKPVNQQRTTKPTHMMAPSERVVICGKLFVSLHQTEMLGVD